MSYNARRFALLAAIAASLWLTACGSGNPQVEPDGLAACLGAQTGAATETVEEAAFPAVADRARGFVHTFQSESGNGPGGFREAVPTELYVMRDMAQAREAVLSLQRAVTEPEQPDIAERRGNLVLVFESNPSPSQLRVLNACLESQEAAEPGERVALWTQQKRAVYSRRIEAEELLDLRRDPGREFPERMGRVVQSCLYGSPPEERPPWPARYSAGPETSDDPFASAVEDPIFESSPEVAAGYPPPLGENAQLPESPSFQIVFMHPRYLGQGARAYIRMAQDGSAFERKIADADGLRFEPIQGDEGVLIYDPANRPPSEEDIEAIRACYREAEQRFGEMLTGKRELTDYSK